MRKKPEEILNALVHVVKVDHGTYTVNHAGFKKDFPNEIAAASHLDIDPIELYHQLKRRGGMTIVFIKGKKHWYG